MAISKEKWKEIEVRLKAYFVRDMKFKLGEDVLSIQRERDGESKTVLAVYINGTINFGWGWCDNEKFNPLTSQVWRKVFKPFYSKQKLAAAKKKLGVRLFNQIYSKKEQTEGITYYSPYFSSSRTLISTFKKIEGLEYLDGGE
nr:hypothetical protein [uncultured Tolumonas sp.]